MIRRMIIGGTLSLGCAALPAKAQACDLLAAAKRVCTVEEIGRCQRSGENYTLNRSLCMPVTMNCIVVDEMACEIASGWCNESAARASFNNFCSGAIYGGGFSSGGVGGGSASCRSGVEFLGERYGCDGLDRDWFVCEMVVAL